MKNQSISGSNRLDDEILAATRPAADTNQHVIFYY
jgi:hypothetical protein